MILRKSFPDTTMKEPNFISAIIYISDYSRNEGDFLVTLDRFLDHHFSHYELIVVNDACKPEKVKKTSEVCNRLNGEVTMVTLAWKHKVELAMLAGSELSIGDYIFEFESTDIDYPFEIVLDLYHRALEGFDMVSAIPQNRQKSSSRIFYSLLDRLSYLKLNLKTESIRIISRRTLNKTIDLKEKIRYRKALYRFTGFPFDEISYQTTSNKIRRIPFRERFKLSIDILFSFSQIGLQISFILSIIFLIISMLTGIYALYIFFFLKIAIEGWTTTMLFLSFGFSGIFFVLSLISKYLTIIMFQVYNRPAFTVKSIEKANKTVSGREKQI